MKFLLPEERWKGSGIPAQSQVHALLYNRPTNSLVAVTARELDDGMQFQRLYYRRLPAEVYRPVGARDLLEDQKDPICCASAPFLFFNEMRYREIGRTPPYLKHLLKGQTSFPTYGGDWFGVRRYNLETGEDRTVLDEDTLKPPTQYSRGWVARLLTVSADGRTAVASVGLQAGGRVTYFVCELSFTDGLKEIIAELPRVFL